MKLSGPDFFEWMGVRRGGLAHGEGRYYDHGNPVSGWLIPDIVDGLLKDGLLELGDPDKSGMRPVALTEAGLTHYRALGKRQRRKDQAAPPEHDRTTETPAGRRLSRKRSVVGPRDQRVLTRDERGTASAPGCPRDVQRSKTADRRRHADLR